MSPVSRADSPALREVAEELHRIADILTELGQRSAKSGTEGRDHSADLSRIQSSLASIANALKGLASGR